VIRPTALYLSASEKTFLFERSRKMPTTSTVINTEQSPREAGTFTRRIGSTTYRVGVHFSRTSKETAKDKIARLIRAEAQRGKAVNS
jgi:hypothetical protein